MSKKHLNKNSTSEKNSVKCNDPGVFIWGYSAFVHFVEPSKTLLNRQ